MNYPKEMYRNNHYRVVHSFEEEAKMQILGWSTEMDRDREDYVVHHSGVAEDGIPEAAQPVRRGPGRPPKNH